ncbi:hypothetical protein WJX75_009618 [Coccomyxa subellipsoidea]|uniref:Uncharacterized protein n=1 Tax=Coccomyxa subellipsoidea TaxID=248742 RepID=A0ABR2Z5A3_9CHLO
MQAASTKQPGAASTVTVDRAWLESLLLDELGSRINSLSDQELMAMLEQLQQAPQLQGGATSAGDSVLERLTGSLPGWFKGSEDSAPDGSAAGRQPVDSTAAPSSNGLPEASTAAAEERLLRGKVFLERARQAAGSAAAAVAAAVASGLQSVPDSSPFRGLESGIGSGLPAAVETALQIALLAGLGVGIYVMLRLLGFDNSDTDPAESSTPNLPGIQDAPMQPTSQAEQGQATRELPSAWDVLKLVPNTLLGLPIFISRPSADATSTALEFPPSSYDHGGPDFIQQPPMGPPAPYRGSASPGRPSQPGNAPTRGVSQTGGQENGRPRDKGRLRNKSVLYNNVEEVPSVRRQSAYIRK